MTRAQHLCCAIIAERQAESQRRRAAQYWQRPNLRRVYLEAAESHEKKARYHREQAEQIVDNSIVALAPVAASIHLTTGTEPRVD